MKLKRQEELLKASEVHSWKKKRSKSTENDKKNGEKKGEPNKLLIFCPLFVFLLGGEGAWKMEGVCF